MTSKKKPAHVSKKKRQKKQKTGQSLAFKLVASIVFVGVLSLGGLYIFSSLQGSPPRPPVSKIHISTYPDVERLVENELLATSHSRGWRRLDSSGDLVRLQMYGDYPESKLLMELATRIALTNSPAQLDLAPRKGIVRVLWQGELRMELHYQVSDLVRRKRPQVAIIMDDMGRNLEGFDSVLALNLSITPSILPMTSHATRGAHFLKDGGHEYMIHLPMEPKRYPLISPGPEALLLRLSKKELQRRLRLYRRRVPGAIGSNNHMGSRFTEDRQAMHMVLGMLKSAGLFFVDSRTIGNSVAFDEARRMGIKTAQRNIFLDNEENVSYISRQLHEMVKIAQEKGTVIAICHPYPETFQALRQNESWLHTQNIDFVLVSRLVKRY